MNDTAPTANKTDVYYELSVVAKSFILAVEIGIALVGVLGNLLVVIVITKRANMKTTMNLYLRNLAIADLGVLCINWPLNTMSAYVTKWPLGKFFCLYVWPTTDLFYGASIWSVTVIAIERYRNIISRRSYGKRAESSRKITLKILVIWLVSFLLVAVPMYPIMTFEENETRVACYPNWPKYMNDLMVKIYTAVLTVFWYIAPLVIITATYSKISSKLKQSTLFHKKMHGDDLNKSQIIKEEEKQRLKQNKKAKRILTPLVVVFAVTMLPYNVFRFLVSFYGEQFYTHYYYYVYGSVCVTFIVINSAVDPVVYYLSSKEFRKVLLPMLSCSARASRDETSKSTKTMSTTQRKLTNPDASVIIMQHCSAQSEM